MGANVTLLRLAGASVLAMAAWQPATADEDRQPGPAVTIAAFTSATFTSATSTPATSTPAPALRPITKAATIEAVPIEMTMEGKEVIAQLRAGQLIGVVSAGKRQTSPLNGPLYGPPNGPMASPLTNPQTIPQTTQVDQTHPDAYSATALKDHLRAGQLIDSGAVSVSELRPGKVDQDQLEAYAATALKDRLRAGQALDSNTLSISELRPGSVDQAELQVYIAMAEEPATTEAASAMTTAMTEVDQTLVFLAAMSVADGSEPVTMETASAIVLKNAGVMPRSLLGYDGVWEFPRMPNKDERELLVGEGTQWRVVENMESQLLFLGPDRRFGWDDFADVINPLQHIPLINIAYRAMTGDEIYGAAQLVDLGMGPLAGVSTVFNLALQETTGADMEDYAMAALFGPPEYYDSSSRGIFAQAEPDSVGIFAEIPTEESEQVATAVRRGASR